MAAAINTNGNNNHAESDEDDDMVMLFQITDIDHDGDIDASSESLADQKSHDNKSRRDRSDSEGCLTLPLITLRERRLMKAYAGALPNTDLKPLAITHAKQIRQAQEEVKSAPVRKLKPRFERMMKKLRKGYDEWEQYHLDELETELCLRHRYNPHKEEGQRWMEDQVLIKMEKKPFTRGAMRQCFRLKKKHSMKCNSSHGLDVSAQNYVAKSYIENVDRDVYFQDVKLQMDAKVWGEEYDKHNPPKKVDIFQMSILEFPDRPNQPLFHLEHYIEGEYIKYNSNSGFVEEHLRLTPQAFSHFTFERSGHQLIVVDVQGVGDLYTDPQIHTSDGNDYGEGNLGPKGMALFFHTHICNSICESMELTPFELSSTELETCRDFIIKQKSESFTQLRRDDEVLSASPIQSDSFDVSEILGRQRTLSQQHSLDDSSQVSSTSEDESSVSMSINSPSSPASPLTHRMKRLRFQSESEADSLTAIYQLTSIITIASNYMASYSEDERRAFSKAQEGKARSSSAHHERELMGLDNIRIGDSVLGQIHHEVAKYHEMGRFSMTEDAIDWDSALYHEDHAAELGVLEAINTMAKLYLGLQRDMFINCTVQSTTEMIDQGVDYMMMAAEAGDRNAMIFMARAFETGLNLGHKREMSWEDAVHWYNEAVVRKEHDESGQYDSTMDDLQHDLIAHQADMYRRGGHGLEVDPQKAGDMYNEAAELAMAAMKGRLANKFFMLAEECYGEMEEEEEG